MHRKVHIKVEKLWRGMSRTPKAVTTKILLMSARSTTKKAPPLATAIAVANGGEKVYYFVDTPLIRTLDVVGVQGVNKAPTGFNLDWPSR